MGDIPVRATVTVTWETTVTESRTKKIPVPPGYTPVEFLARLNATPNLLGGYERNTDPDEYVEIGDPVIISSALDGALSQES